MNTNNDRVCVTNLPPDIRIKDIDDFFRPFGRVVNIDVNNRSNPVYAYVQFDNARNAFNAVRSRHGYDYEGYTLQLRLVESEVMKSRDFTPPPPPPPMFNNYERQNNGGGPNNNYGISLNRMGGNFPNTFPGNQNAQWTNTNNSVAQHSQGMARPNMLQQNMNYPTNIRQQDTRMQMETARPNIVNQFPNTNRSNMQQQFPNANFSNSQQQYSNLNRSNMSQQNINFPNRSDILQQNMMPYSDNGRSTMQQQYNRNNSNMPKEQINMMGFNNNNSSWNNNNNSSWNSNNNMNRNSGNHGIDQNVYNNAGPNEIYNSNNNYDTKEFDDTSRYTSGLSGSGRKWFHRYMQDGLTPEKARAKALGHRTLPYLREDPKNKQIPGDNTNAALETIGNTIISLLSTNQVDHFRPGPSSSLAQTPSSATSKGKHLASVDKDKILTDETPDKSGENSNKTEKDKPIASSSREAMLWHKFLQKKQELLIEAARKNEGKRKHKGKSYKRRMKSLMNEAGISELEAKPLSVLPPEKFNDLFLLKKEYDKIRNSNCMPKDKAELNKAPNVKSYLNDIKYLETHYAHTVAKLSKPVLESLMECITRVHNYETDHKLPPTRNKFIKLVRKYAALKLTGKSENKTIDVATTTAKANAKKKSNQNRKNFKRKNKKNVAENIQVNMDITENQQELENDETIATSNSAVSDVELWDKIRKRKEELLIEATSMYEGQRRRRGEAFKNRAKRLMNEAGISELEANSLAILQVKKLNDLIDLIKEYNMATKPIIVPGNRIEDQRIADYLNDVKYISMHENQRLAKLSKAVRDELSACVTRLHHYEKKYKVPPIRTTFIRLLRKVTFTQKKPRENKVITAATTAEKEGNQTSNALKPNEESIQESMENQCNENITENQQGTDNVIEDNQEKQDITEEPHDFNKEMKEDQQNNDVEGQNNDNFTEDNQENEDITEERHDLNKEFKDTKSPRGEMEQQDQQNNDNFTADNQENEDITEERHDLNKEFKDTKSPRGEMEQQDQQNNDVEGPNKE